MSNSLQFGVRFGAVVCVADAAAQTEVCDACDNDCDGFTDENVSGNPLSRSCYAGPAGTAGVGICVAGTETCGSGTWGSCNGQVLPGTEACDALDNDCDGFVNESNPGGGLSCSTGQPGICATGTTVCSGNAISCVPNNSNTMASRGPTTRHSDQLRNEKNMPNAPDPEMSGKPRNVGLTSRCKTR